MKVIAMFNVFNIRNIEHHSSQHGDFTKKEIPFGWLKGEVKGVFHTFAFSELLCQNLFPNHWQNIIVRANLIKKLKL